LTKHLSLIFAHPFINQGAIPQSLGNLGNLKKLWLENNKLEGQFFVFRVGQCPLTTRVSPIFVQFHAGSIPASLGNVANLKQLCLFSNQLAGPFFSFWRVISPH
jgi:Leucine-rich repeat (LRR) protein